MAHEQKKDTPGIYEIRVQGHLDREWSEWFYEMRIIHEHEGTTTLRGPLPDQTVLDAVLDRIRDMNLPLVSVIQIETDGITFEDEGKGGQDE